jgi:hypothetical protein
MQHRVPAASDRAGAQCSTATRVMRAYALEWRGGISVIDMAELRIVVFVRVANFYRSNGKLRDRNGIGAFASCRPQSLPPLATAINALAENAVRLSREHGA